MFNITFADAQIAVLVIAVGAFVLGRMQSGLFRLLSESQTSSQRLFYERRAALRRRA